jgi:hypothetical protein
MGSDPPQPRSAGEDKCCKRCAKLTSGTEDAQAARLIPPRRHRGRSEGAALLHRPGAKGGSPPSSENLRGGSFRYDRARCPGAHGARLHCPNFGEWFALPCHKPFVTVAHGAQNTDLIQPSGVAPHNYRVGRFREGRRHFRHPCANLRRGGTVPHPCYAPSTTPVAVRGFRRADVRPVHSPAAAVSIRPSAKRLAAVRSPPRPPAPPVFVQDQVRTRVRPVGWDARLGRIRPASLIGHLLPQCGHCAD